MINTFNNFVEIILCIYAIVKHISGKISFIDNNNKFYFIYELLCIILSLLICVLTTLIFLPLAIFKKTIGLYLYIKFGNRCYGLLEGIDAVWASETEEAKHIVNGIVFIQLKTSPEDFIIRIKQKIKETRQSRLNSSLHSILGYWYTVHSDTIVDRIVRPISLTNNETLDKCQFERRISRLANESLPKLSAYELLICVEPIKFSGSKTEETKSYAVVVRLHHIMGDGLDILSLLQNIADKVVNSTHGIKVPPCSDNNGISYKENIFSKDLILNYLSNAINAIRNVPIYFFGISAPSDKNLLHGPNLSGDKILAFHLEENVEYISKIKSIKCRINDCTFTDVIYTALSASLWDYFNKYTQNIPSNITTSFITRFRNCLCAATLKIPIQVHESSTASKNLIGRLNIILKSHRKMRKCIDPMVFYWLHRGCSLLPITISRILCKMNMKTTISFSNLPGPEDSMTIDGEHIKNLVFWTPNVAKIGVGFTVLSYNGRLQMGLIADKILLPEHEDASIILKNVFKYIDLLAEETNIKS